MRILLVEDEPHLQKLMQVHFERERWEVMTCDQGETALEQVKDGGFDLVVLDWMLAGKLSGVDVCRELSRASPKPPILMVTARTEPADIVLGLEMGADDYVTKPFEMPVLLARIRALARRAMPTPTGPTPVYEIGNLKITIDKFEVQCCKSKVELTPSEFKLLVAMIEERGRVLSRGRLLKKIQDQGVNVVERIVDTHVYALRRKLGDCADFIETIRGIGYRIKE